MFRTVLTQEKEIEVSLKWRIDKQQTTGYDKRPREEVVLIALFAAHSNASQPEFRNHNLLTTNLSLYKRHTTKHCTYHTIAELGDGQAAHFIKEIQFTTPPRKTLPRKNPLIFPAAHAPDLGLE
ncbi:hypothetical protein QYM36_019484, partial [Artemia franciscana]